MPDPSPLGTSVKETLDALPGMGEHPSGHTQNLLRYRLRGGPSIGVHRVETTSLRLWVLENEAFAAAARLAGFEPSLSVPPPKGKTGRNSNLEQIPEFKRKPLHWTPVTSPAQAATLVGLLFATMPERPADAETPPAVEPVPEPSAPVAAAEVPATAPDHTSPVDPAPPMTPEIPVAQPPTPAAPSIPTVADDRSGTGPGDAPVPASDTEAAGGPAPAASRPPIVPPRAGRGLIARFFGRLGRRP